MADSGAIPENGYVTTSDEVQINMLDKFHLVRGLFSPHHFKTQVRPRIYKKANNDPEKVQELTLKLLSENHKMLGMLSTFFGHPDELSIAVRGRRLIPFGTAAGMDKDGSALKAFSHFFGFLEPGTVVVNPRIGNARPRVAVDDAALDVYNAQGFPSKGLEYFKEKIIDYRKSHGKAPVYISICGLPLSEEKAVDIAMDEMTVLLKALNEHADGFVWDPASPNTAALKILKEPELFRQTSELMKQYAPNKLRLVKLWPYEDHETQESMKFVNSFMDGGGHGIVTVNTMMHPKEQVPHPNWGYKSAGRSGKFLKPHRMRSVKDIRKHSPDSIIIATGGIYDGHDAYETFKAGADMLEGYTPYTFYGLGLLKQIETDVVKRLRQDGYQNLEEMQAAMKEKRAKEK